MATKTVPKRTPEPVKQLSVFTANRMGRLHELIGLLSSHKVHVLALSVLDTSDSSIIRVVVDDPEKARGLLRENGFPFNESDLLVVEMDSTVNLGELITAMLEAELNINYLYSFIPHPEGKSIIALSVEDNDMAETILRRHQFRILRQADISR